MIRALALAVALTPALAFGQDPLPERILQELETARLAAEKGDSGPAVKAVAAIGSRSLTTSQRGAVASELEEIADELTALRVLGAALDVYRAVARTFSDTKVAVSAEHSAGETLVALGDRASALKVYAGLIGPTPAGAAPVVRSAREQFRAQVLRAYGNQLLALRRPAAALQAFLDAEVWSMCPRWADEPLGGTIDGLGALHALCPGIDPNSAAHREAARAAVALTELREVTGPDGRPHHVERRASDVLAALAGILAARKDPAAGLVLSLSKKPPPRRGYAFAPMHREHLIGARLLRARVARQRAALTGVRKRAAAGDPAALLTLHELHETGWVVPIDAKRAADLLAKACARGYGPALLEAAQHVRTPRAARTYYLQALAAGEERALLRVAQKPTALTAESRKVVRRLAAAGRALAWRVLAADCADPKRRRALLVRAVRGGDLAAALSLAELHTQGAPGVPADKAEALFWRRLALQGGRYAKDRHWAEALRHGGEWRDRLPAAAKRYPAAAEEQAWVELIGRRPEAAVGWALRGIAAWNADVHGLSPPILSSLWAIRRRHRRLAPAMLAALSKRTDPAGLHLYGDVVARGRLGRKPDPTRGLALHRQESKAAGRPACNELLAAIDAPGGPAAVEQERAWARKASAAGDAWAEAYLGQLLEAGVERVGDPDAARACYTRAAKRGSAVGHLLLSDMERALEEIAGAPRASVDAHLRKAAELGHRQAWVILARRLEQRGDAEGAAEAWKRGAAAGEPNAIDHRAALLLRGAAPTEAQVKAALPLLREAAAAGSSDAYVRLLVALHERPKLRIAGDP